MENGETEGAPRGDGITDLNYVQRSMVCTTVVLRRTVLTTY